MSNEQNRMSEEELIKAAGGKGSLSSLGGGPVLRVKGVTSGSLSLKSAPGEGGAELAQLKNGDIVQASGGRMRTGDDSNGNRSVTYTQVYVPSLKQSGWIDSDFLG